MAADTVAVVILNYDGRDLLEQYLPSIVNLDYEAYRVIVVDNASTDGSVAFLKQEYPEITVVENETNLGISRGLNRGAEAAPDADYLWFLNNDVEVTESSLSRLVDHISSTTDTGIVFPRINDMGTERIQTLGFDYDMFAHRNWPPHDAGRTEPSDPEPHEIAHGMGAAMLVSRDAWEAIGGFDEHNFAYGDDTYLCLQAWVRGYHVEVVPDAVVYHEKEATLNDERVVSYHEIRNKTRTYLKTVQLRTLILGFPGFLVLLAGQILKDIAIRREPRLAFIRVRGFLAAVGTLPEILRSRRRIQRERAYTDDRYLTPLSETWP